jgi:hypothetical protein
MKEKRKKSKVSQTSYLLSRVFTNEVNSRKEEIVFTDYFSARKAAKKIIQESAEVATDELAVKNSDNILYKEIAPDHWISENETIIISTIGINN